MTTYTFHFNNDDSEKLTTICRKIGKFKQNRQAVVETALDMLYKFYEDRRWRN